MSGRRNPWALPSTWLVRQVCPRGKSPVDEVLKRSGFTLVELLVSIVIIIVLAALVFAVGGRVKEKAKSAQCVSNLRQLGIEVQGAANELGYFPPSVSQGTSDEGGVANLGNDWGSLLRSNPCIGCPSAKHSGTHPTIPTWQISAYGANPMVCGRVMDNDPPYVRPVNITRPADVILFADGAQFDSDTNPRSISMCAGWWLPRDGEEKDAGKPLTTREIPDGGWWGQDTSLLPMRHDGSANVLFVDGSIRSIRGIGELKQRNLYWNY